MKSILSFTLFVFVAGSQLFAQNRYIGKVVDFYSRQPIGQVAIIFTSGKTEFSNNDGSFIIQDSMPVVDVDVTAIGYTQKKISLLPGMANIISLHPSVTNLKEVKLDASFIGSGFTVLNKIDLRLNPVKSAQDLLRSAPGLFVSQHAGGGKAEQIFLRGFDVDHGTDVSVNVDGMPVNMVSHAHGQGYADAHFIIPETINNLDFGAGPYYAAYGNFTTAGFINMSSFDNIDNSRIQVEAGRFNTYRTLLMLDLLKKQKDNESAYIAADYNYADGPTEAKQHFNRYNLFAKYNRSLSGSTQLTASVSTFYSKWDASGQVPQRAVNSGLISRFGSIDPTEGGTTSRHNINILLSTYLNDQLHWENQLYYSRYAFNLYSNFTFYAEDSVNGDGIQQSEGRNLVGFNTKITQKNNIGLWQIRSTMAIGSRHDFTEGSSLNKQVKRVFIAPLKSGNITESNLHAYINQQFKNRKWVFDLSLRADYFTHHYKDLLNEEQYAPVSNAMLSPKINVQYNFNSRVQLYTKAGKGFHSNDTRVVVSDKNLQTLPAAYGTDLGVILKPNRNLLLNIALWHLYLQQEFIYVGDAGVVEPGGRTERVGIDVVARYQFSKKIFANTNINITRAKALGLAKGQDHIPLAPGFTSTGGIYYRQARGWNAGISYRYIKDRAANEENSIVAGGYFLLDASVQYSRSKYEYGLVMENLLNSKWNEAQFATESRLRNEALPVNELHFTPGNPFFIKARLAVFF